MSNKIGYPAGLSVKKGAVANMMNDAINIAGKNLNQRLYIKSQNYQIFFIVIEMINPEIIKNSSTPYLPNLKRKKSPY